MIARLFLVCAAATVLQAAPDSAERIREGESRQMQLLTETRGLVEQMDAMLAEYARNGLTGEDVTTVERLRASLDRLTTAEMRSVLSLLQKARAQASHGAAKKEVADAYAAQKAILARMDQLLAEHARAQQALELSQAAARLADRQAANLQNGIELGKWIGGKKLENLEQALQANLQGQAVEEAALAEDSKALAGKLRTFLEQAAASPEIASRFQKSIEELDRTQSKVSSAAEALKQGQLFKAVTQEKEARDALRRIARQVAPPQSDSEMLRSAGRDLTRLIEEQTQLANDAAKANTEFEDWIKAAARQQPAEPRWQRPVAQLRADEQLVKQFETARRESVEQLPALENAQGDVANKSDLLAQDVAAVASDAADSIRAAQAQMQEARIAMSDKAPQPAASAAQQARSALEKALAEINQRAAQLDIAAGQLSGNPVQDRRALQEAVAQLARQQAAAAAQRNPAGQAAVAQQAQQFARQAIRLAPNAAQALQQAAQLAQQAARAANAQQAAAAQQGAAQQLAQAAQQIAQEMAAAQQAQQQLAVVRRAAEELAKIIQAEQKLHLDTSTAQARFAPGKEQLFAGLDSRQRSIREDTEFFRDQTSGFTSRESMQDAVHNMRRTAQALDKPDGEIAMEAEQSALADLYRAQAALDQQMERLRDEAGEPDPDNAAAVAAQIAQAQAALAMAQQSLAQAQVAQAAPPAAQAAQIAGQTAAQGGLPPMASQALQAAAQQAAQASAQAAADQAQAANASAQAAQQSLAQAQAALNASQSGLTASSASSASGQSGETAAQSDQSGGTGGVDRGARAVSAASSSFANLPPRERAVIQQSAGEKYPAEYGPLVEQYLRNLADDSLKR